MPAPIPGYRPASMVLCGDRHGSLDDNVIVITGTRGPDEILVREHFSGAGIYDIVADGQMIRQFGVGVVPHSVCIATRGATTGCGCTHEIRAAKQVIRKCYTGRVY